MTPGDRRGRTGGPRRGRAGGRPRGRDWGRAGLKALPLLSGLVVVGVLFLAVFPTRTFLAQRRERAATERRLQLLVSQNRKLEEQSHLLLTDAEIERLAREQYNLVRPGEEAYALLPGGTSAGPTGTIPAPPPAPPPAPAPAVAGQPAAAQAKPPPSTTTTTAAPRRSPRPHPASTTTTTTHH